MKINKLITSQIMSEFDLDIINIANVDLNREVRGAAINRAGLELQGQKNHHQKSHIIGWGSKESQWFTKIGVKKSIIAMSNILSTSTPLILLSKGVTDKIMQLVVKEANLLAIPVCLTNEHLSASISTIGSYLANYFAPHKEIHGSLVNVNGVGIAIIGEPGIGKSEAVLELIQNNHFFVSDDTIVLKRIGKQFIGYPAPITSGLLEARGIGLIDVSLIYGLKVMKDSSTVDLVVELLFQDHTTTFDRLGNKILTYEVLNSSIPKVQIPVNKGRSLAVLIEASANVFLAKKNGDDPIDKINLRKKMLHDI